MTPARRRAAPQTEGRALIIVDVQNDFCEGGSLAVSGGSAVAERIAGFVSGRAGRFAAIAATKDWHVDPGLHFASSVPAEPDFEATWPDHCVAGTTGAAFHAAIEGTIAALRRQRQEAAHERPSEGGPAFGEFRKGELGAAYSGFDGSLAGAGGIGLGDWLRAEGVSSVEIAGIATDFCVRATALDAARQGFETCVITDLCAGVDEGGSRLALAELEAAGVSLFEAASLDHVVEAAGTDATADDGRLRPRRRPDLITVEVAVVVLSIRDAALAVLLVPDHRPGAGGSRGLPGGFVRRGEDVDAAAERVLLSTGLSASAAVPGHLEQLRTYGSNEAGGGVVVAYLALIARPPARPGEGEGTSGTWSEVGVSRHLSAGEERVLADGVERAHAKLEYTSLATSFVDEPFTIADLRRVYEAVWGEPLHAANFRRKVIATPGFVVPTGERRSVGRGAGVELFGKGGSAVLHPPLLRGRRSAADLLQRPGASPNNPRLDGAEPA